MNKSMLDQNGLNRLASLQVKISKDALAVGDAAKEAAKAFLWLAETVENLPELFPRD